MTLSFAIDDLVRQLPDGTVVTDEVRLDKYRRDRSQDPNVGMPFEAPDPNRSAWRGVWSVGWSFGVRWMPGHLD